MPKFIIETTAESPIREFWQVEAETAEAARDAFEAGEVGAFLWDEVQGDETDREVSEVHAFADMASTVAIDRAQNEAPAMVEALRDILACCDANQSPADTIEAARAILARIDGNPNGVRYCVDGLTHADPDTAEYQGDGQFAPFVIFDIQEQRNLPGEYETREAAEAALARIDGEGVA